jgi:hypothetical protein
MKLKRTLVAFAFAVIAVPAVAAEWGPPYEQTVQDMQLPNVKDPVVDQSASSGATFFGMHEDKPYSQLDVDMALPNVKDPVVKDQAASQRIVVAGPAMGVSSPDATGASSEATGPWANDWNFIAPAP